LAEENYKQWEDVYRRGGEGPYPWDLGRPRDFLVQLLEKGMIEGDRALDTCCGLGTNGLYLAEKGFNVTGIDISDKAVKIANRKSGRNENINFKVRNFMDMDFEPGSFDFVLDIGCFHHVATEDRQEYIENVRQVLRPGGRYLVMCFSDRMGPAWNHFSEEQVRDLFSGPFEIMTLDEISSVEGDGKTRTFYVSLMEKPIDII